MQFRVGDRVELSGKTGVICALVRSDDDPRKCVPMGERLVLRGDLPLLGHLSYLVKMDGSGRLKWSRGQTVTPVLPQPRVAPSGGRHASVVDDARLISDGTMALLTGLRQTLDLMKARQQFVQHIIAAEGCGQRYSSWIDAWRWFVNGSFGDTMPAYDETDRLYVRVRSDAPSTDRAAWISPDGSEWFCPAEKPATLDEATRQGGFGNGNGYLTRIGFLRRHWFLGRKRDEFDAWLKDVGMPSTTNSKERSMRDAAIGLSSTTKAAA